MMRRKTESLFLFKFGVFLWCLAAAGAGLTAYSSEGACPADASSAAPAADLFTLQQIVRMSAQRSEDILKDDLDVKLWQLSLEHAVSEYLPRADIHSSVYYSDASERGELGDAFRSNLNVNWNLINAWKIFFRKKYMEKNAAYRDFLRVQVVRRSQAKAIAFYYDHWGAADRRRIVAQEKILSERKYANARFAFENEMISRKDLDAAKREFEETCWSYDDADLLCRQSRERLSRFLLLSESAEFDVPPDLDLPEIPPLQDAISKSLGSSEALRTSEERVKAAKEAMRGAAWRRWTLFNTSFYAGNSVRLHSGFDQSGSAEFSYGAELKWTLPVFDGGYYRRRQKEAGIYYEKALLEHEDLPLQIMEKVTEMWRELTEKRKGFLLAGDILKTREKSFELVKFHYDVGKLSEMEKEKALLELQRARSDHLLKNYEYIVTKANLDFFCGDSPSWILAAREPGPEKNVLKTLQEAKDP